MISLPEAGYTPANLRALIEQSGLTQAQAGELLDPPAAPKTMRGWLAPVDSPAHRDMPLKKWIDFLSAVKRTSK